MTHRRSNNPYRPIHINSLLYVLFMFMTMPGLRMDINVTLPWAVKRAVTSIILHANNDKNDGIYNKIGAKSSPPNENKSLIT